MYVTAENLLASSYKKHPAHHKGENVTLYQKRVRSPASGFTLYFIDIYEYDFSEYYSYSNLKLRYYVEVQFTDSDSYTINISFDCGDRYIEQLEEKVEEIFTTLNCRPYSEVD